MEPDLYCHAQHPAGRIGKRLILNVRDVMKQEAGLPVVHPDITIVNALVELSSKVNPQALGA